MALSLGMAPSFRPFLPEFSQEVPGGIPQTLAKRSGAKWLSFDRARHFSIFFSLSHRPLQKESGFSRKAPSIYPIEPKLSDLLLVHFLGPEEKNQPERVFRLDAEGPPNIALVYITVEKSAR
jgi:hypothetical protein